MLASTWPWPKSTPATTTVYWICSPKNYAWHTPNYVPSLASSRATICWARFFPASASGSEAESMDIHLSLSRSEEHTSELQSLMRISYAVFCLKKKNDKIISRITIDFIVTGNHRTHLQRRVYSPYA